MRIGIDGSNLREGGGVTHLLQLLHAADPPRSGVERVVVWGNERLIAGLTDRPWLTRVPVPALEGGALVRARWQQWQLARTARGSVDLLFAPGGTYLGGFHPFVTMFRNMLPFDAAERARYGMSAKRLKFAILRRTQAATFRRADGLIFLTEHARTAIHDAGVRPRGREAVIPHGLDPAFFAATPSAPRDDYSIASPFRWLYVSVIHLYKHPWNVAEAAARLRSAGFPLTLDIVGPAHPPAAARLHETVTRLDPQGTFLRVRGAVPHGALPAVYSDADGFVFASTCENMPNSLLEAMAAGLPIACSDRLPMPEILRDGGVYFNPESVSSIESAMREVMTDRSRRAQLGGVARSHAQAFTWTRCARETFDFCAGVARA